MAKKDRSDAANASKPKRSKTPSPAATPAPPPPRPDKLRITRAPPKTKSSDLNNQVTVHIISAPSDGSSPVSQRTGRVIAPTAPAAAAPAPAPTPASAPTLTPAPAPKATPTLPAAAAQPSTLRLVSSTPAPKSPAPTASPAQAAPAVATLRVPATPTAHPAPPTPPAHTAQPAPVADIRRDSPPAGTPVDIGAPTPVHKSALNLTPMEEVLWAARLQKAKEVVAAQMKVRVTNGKLVRRYTAIDHDDGLFEIETTKGFYVVVLSKTGAYSIYWRHDRKAY